MALWELSKFEFANAVIMISSQRILNNHLAIPKPYESFDVENLQSNLDDALVSSLEYAVAAVMLPFFQSKRLCPHTNTMQDTIFQKRLLHFSLNMFREKGRFVECSRQIYETTKTKSCCHIAVFGGKPLEDNKQVLLTEQMNLYNLVSLHYGDWSAVGNNLLMISLEEVDPDQIYDQRTVQRWAASYAQKVRYIL